jgi:hypothetical protein
MVGWEEAQSDREKDLNSLMRKNEYNQIVTNDNV